MNAWKEVWKLGPEGSVETRTGRKCGSNRIGLRRLKRTEKAEKIERLKRTEKAEKIERQKRTVKEREAAKAREAAKEKDWTDKNMKGQKRI